MVGVFSCGRAFRSHFNLGVIGGVVLSFGIQQRFDAAISYIRDILTDGESKLLIDLVEDAKNEARVRLYAGISLSFVVGFIFGALIF